MTSKTKYSIIIIAVVGLVFLIFSSIKWMYWELEYLLIAKILYIIGFISLGLYFLAKDWRKVLTKIMLYAFSISLILSVYLSYQYYEWNKHYEILNEYEQIATCEKLKERFATDLENSELKYFQFGFGFDIELQRSLKNKYGIESFGMGCLVDMKMECYNDLVNNYLIEKHNDRVLDY